MQFILAGAVRYNVPRICAARVCRAPLEVNRLCSSTLSVNCEQVTKNTEEKILCRSLFRSGHMSAICAGLGSKGKVGVQRGRETAGVPSFLPTAVGTASLPPSADGESPAEVQRKTFRPERVNTLTQFAHPGFPVQKRSRPVRANTLTQFEHPAGSVQKKFLKNFQKS